MRNGPAVPYSLSSTRLREPAGSFLDRFSPEPLFVVSGIAQYTGAVIAVSLFD